MQAICVYCGSSDKSGEKYLHAARQMGAAVVERGLGLVYGGGGTGLMGALAEGALQSGGEVTGIITEQFNTPALAQDGLTHMEVFPNMHERKARMAELADGFIALPGGFGTLDEFFEALTWAQIGLHAKPLGLLNLDGFFDPLLAFLQKVEAEGFTYTEHGQLYRQASTPEALLDALLSFESPSGLHRWVQRES